MIERNETSISRSNNVVYFFKPLKGWWGVGLSVGEVGFKR